MKTIAILMCMLATTAWAGEELLSVDSNTQWYIPKDANMTITTIEPAKYMTFGYDKEEGKLTWESGVFKFSGDPDKSAVIFLDWMQQHYNDRQEFYCSVAKVMPGEAGKIFKWVDEKQDAEIIQLLEDARSENETMIRMAKTLKVKTGGFELFRWRLDDMIKRLK